MIKLIIECIPMFIVTILLIIGRPLQVFVHELGHITAIKLTYKFCDFTETLNITVRLNFMSGVTESNFYGYLHMHRNTSKIQKLLRINLISGIIFEIPVHIITNYVVFTSKYEISSVGYVFKLCSVILSLVTVCFFLFMNYATCFILYFYYNCNSIYLLHFENHS